MLVFFNRFKVYTASPYPRVTMGQTLSEPVTTKETSSYSNENMKVGTSAMQGWRINMEDAHTVIINVPDQPDTAFFGIYDGHGGMIN